MAENDLSSLGWSLIPAALGLAFGGPAGAAFGLSSGVADAAHNRISTDKLNADIQFKNQQAALEQQRNNQAQERIGFEREQLAAQQKRWETEDRRAEKLMQYQDVQMQKLGLEMDQARTTIAGRQAFRANLDPTQQAEFDSNPESYLAAHAERRKEEARLQGAGAMLGQFGIRDGDAMARVLGPTGTSHLLASMIESRNRAALDAKNHFGFHFDPNTGTAFTFNQQTGAVTSKVIEGAKKPMTAERRTAIETSVRKTFEESVPEVTRIANPGMYDQWRASPYGKLAEGLASGEINYEQSQGMRDSIQRMDAQDTADATTWMLSERAKANPGVTLTQESQQKYLNSPEGQANLQSYKSRLQSRGWGRGVGGAAPTAPAARAPATNAPAAAPQRMKFDAQGNLVK